MNQALIFDTISGKKVQADFDGGEITSDAGILFLKETEGHVGIIDLLSNCIRDRRHQSYVKQTVKDTVILGEVSDGRFCG